MLIETDDRHPVVDRRGVMRDFVVDCSITLVFMSGLFARVAPTSQSRISTVMQSGDYDRIGLDDDIPQCIGKVRPPHVLGDDPESLGVGSDAIGGLANGFQKLHTQHRAVLVVPLRGFIEIGQGSRGEANGPGQD